MPGVMSHGTPAASSRRLGARLALAGGAPPPTLRIPVGTALAAGSAVEKVWGLGEHDDEPPLTRFLAEQMSTAHWFDQRRTRTQLDWVPAVSVDRGLELLAAHYRRG